MFAQLGKLLRHNNVSWRSSVVNDGKPDLSWTITIEFVGGYYNVGMQ